MARTRGGGVISGASARPRRNIGKPSLAGTRGHRCPALPRSSPPTTGSTETAAADALPDSSNATAICATEGQARQLSRQTEGGCHTFRPQSGYSIVIGTRAMGGSPFTTGIPGEVATTVADEDAGDVLDADFLRVFDDELGDGDIGIDDNVDNTSLDDIADNIIKHPSPEMGDDAGSTANQSNSQRRAAVRKSPLSPPKVPVWRMLYIDPDVADPRLVAGLLGSAASQALGCACVFDVATDIVEALADVHGGAMWVYRGVFINESLIRHRKLGRGKTADTSIQGKHLAQFLRQVGMSRTRIILLVAGGVDFDTADAGAHGLSAVLRKPFTKTGFWNILRGMYLGSEPTTVSAAEASPPTQGSPQACHGRRQHSTTGSRRPKGVPLATEAPPPPPTGRSSGSAAAIVGGPTAMHVGAPVLTRSPYPACLGFTPFTHPMISAYHLSPGLLRPRQLHAGPRRKYTKIAPREEDEAVAGLPAPVLDGTSPDAPVAADVNILAAAVDRVGDQGVLPSAAGAGSLVKGEGGMVRKNFAPGGGDGCASGAAQELPQVSASSVDYMFSGESSITRGSTYAVCPDPPNEEAAAAPTLAAPC